MTSYSSWSSLACVNYVSRIGGKREEGGGKREEGTGEREREREKIRSGKR